MYLNKNNLMLQARAIQTEKAEQGIHQIAIGYKSVIVMLIVITTI